MRYRRIKTPGASYFLTVNLANRQSTLLLDKINQFRKSLVWVKSRHPFTIEGIVILPEHFHIIMTLPENDDNYSQRLMLIKAHFSRSINAVETISLSRNKKRERGIWQRRFWEHCIRDDKDFNNHLDYIHFNPVKHGYVENPFEWKHSSIHRYYPERSWPILDD